MVQEASIWRVDFPGPSGQSPQMCMGEAGQVLMVVRSPGSTEQEAVCRWRRWGR